MHPNCRCTTIGYDPEDELDELETEQEELSYEEWRDRYISDNSPEKSLDKSVESGIIEMTRRNNGTHLKIGNRGLQIIDKPTYNALTKDFVKRGGIIVRGEEAEKHLGEKYYASYLPSFNTAVIRDDATVSEVLEEMYHAMQDRTNMFGSVLTHEVFLKREIDAQQYLLSMAEKYKSQPKRFWLQRKICRNTRMN